MESPKRARNNSVEILIVEDSPTQAEHLKYLLEEHGYKVTVAANGKEALAAVHRRKPTLIISDIVMPEMDGYTLCKAIKAQEQLKDIPVLLVTALSSPQDVIRGLQCGADSFIRKPYDEKYLLSRIVYILANWELRASEKVQIGVEIHLAGEKYFITSARQQILNLLISTYEEAIALSEDLKVRQRELERSYQSLGGLYRLAKGLNQATSEQGVVEKALERAMELPGVQAGWIVLWDGKSGFRTVATRGLPPALEVPGALEGDCLCRRKLLSGELTAVTNIHECERLQKAKGDTRGLRYHASIPLWVGDRKLGLMNLVGAEQGLFSDRDLEILNGVGNQMGIALDRARLYERLEKMVEERTATLTAEIAERRRAEERLTLFRSLIDHTNDTIEIIDPATGRFLDVNEKACLTHGYTREEYLALTVPEIDPIVAARPWAEMVEELRRSGSLVVESQHRRKDGSIFPVEVNATYIRLDRDYMLAVVRDITERKRMEGMVQALYRAGLAIQEPLGLQERLNHLLQAARDILHLDRLNILLADPEGRWLQEVASFGAEEPLEAIRVPIGPEGGGLAQAYVTQQPIIWLDSQAPVPEALRLKPPYDRIAAFRSRAFMILPLVVQGRSIGVLGADRKHSRQPLDQATLDLLHLFAAQAAIAIEQARLYDKLQLSAIQLEAKVEDRTRELQEAMRQLEEASRHKSEFLANMSHELRTPLNSILGFSQILQEQTFGPLTEKQARYVQHILTSGQHLLALINDILDLSKVEAGKLELRPEPFDLREALAAALHEIRPQADAKRLMLQLSVDEALSTLTADPIRFKQILLNLLSNAVKFTPEGGQVTVRARRVEDVFVEIAVTDTGIGIKPEDLPRLFQPFTQLEGVYAKRHQGTGLGLALTKRLVELHGGTIWADSEGEGKGSTFTVRLPLAKKAVK